MLLVVVVFGYVTVFTVPGLCCHSKEYVTTDGQCCPLCNEGTYVKRDCTPHSGTRCSSCGNGTFMNRPNGLDNCFSCSSCNQDQGLFVQQECKTTRDTVCEVISGYFCRSLTDDTGCSLAEKHTCCEAGQGIKEPGTRRTDTVCEHCQPGTFSEDGVKCIAWTFCSETQVMVKEGTISSDVVCATALRGQYIYPPLLLLAVVIAGLCVIWTFNVHIR